MKNKWCKKVFSCVLVMGFLAVSMCTVTFAANLAGFSASSGGNSYEVYISNKTKVTRTGALSINAYNRNGNYVKTMNSAVKNLNPYPKSGCGMGITATDCGSVQVKGFGYLYNGSSIYTGIAEVHSYRYK